MMNFYLLDVCYMMVLAAVLVSEALVLFFGFYKRARSRY
jgi:hypothetical protein